MYHPVKPCNQLVADGVPCAHKSCSWLFPKEHRDARDDFILQCHGFHNEAIALNSDKGRWAFAEPSAYPPKLLAGGVPRPNLPRPFYKPCASAMVSRIAALGITHGVDINSGGPASALHFIDTRGVTEPEHSFWVPSLRYGTTLWAVKAELGEDHSVQFLFPFHAVPLLVVCQQFHYQATHSGGNGDVSCSALFLQWDRRSMERASSLGETDVLATLRGCCKCGCAPKARARTKAAPRAAVGTVVPAPDISEDDAAWDSVLSVNDDDLRSEPPPEDDIVSRREKAAADDFLASKAELADTADELLATVEAELEGTGVDATSFLLEASFIDSTGVEGTLSRSMGSASKMSAGSASSMSAGSALSPQFCMQSRLRAWLLAIHNSSAHVVLLTSPVCQTRANKTVSLVEHGVDDGDAVATTLIYVSWDDIVNDIGRITRVEKWTSLTGLGSYVVFQPAQTRRSLAARLALFGGTGGDLCNMLEERQGIIEAAGRKVGALTACGVVTPAEGVGFRLAIPLLE